MAYGREINENAPMSRISISTVLSQKLSVLLGMSKANPLIKPQRNVIRYFCMDIIL